MSDEYEIGAATSRDLGVIQQWLKAEYERDHCGFYYNFVSPNCGTVWVCKKTGSVGVLGFLCGQLSRQPSMDIMQVREEYRRMGIGQRLVAFFLANSRQYDPLGIDIQCNPRASIPFWARMGFVEVQQVLQNVENFHYRAYCFHTSTNLENKYEKTIACVRLSKFKGLPSSTNFETTAIMLDGEIHLKDHFCAYVHDPDAVVEIVANGALVFKDRVQCIRVAGGERVGSFVRLRAVKVSRHRSV